MNPSPAVTVVVHVDDAQRTLRPCLHAWDAAMGALRDAGGVAELVVVVRDDPSAAAEAARWRDQPGVTVLSSPGRTEGEALDQGVAAARHDVVCVADAADLVPSNILTSGLAVLASAGRRAVVHPAEVVRFGRSASVQVVADMESGAVTAADAVFADPWPQVALAHREIFAAVPFRSLPTHEGLGPTSWAWNLDTVAAGFSHRVDAAVRQFRRHRFPRAGTESAVLLLPRLDLEALIEALPDRIDSAHDATEPQRAATPGRWSRVLRRVRRRLAAARRPQGPPAPPPPLSAAPHDRALATIDPAISWTVEHLRELPRWDGRDDGYGALLLDAALRLGSGGAVVAVPWLGVGGSDLAAVEYVRAFRDSARFAGRARLLTTDSPQRTLAEHVPDDIELVQLADGLSGLAADWRQRLIAQLVVFTAPDLLLGANCHHLTDAMNLAGDQMCRATRLSLTLFSFDRRGDDLPSSPLADEGMRRALDGVAGVITDNAATARQASESLGLDAPILRTIALPALDPHPPLNRDSAAWADLDPAQPIRLLWPHRLDREKRPDVLPELMRRLAVAGVPAQLDVWGSAVFGDSAPLVAALEQAGIRYRGPYSGGLSTLPVDEYHAMLITSATEGTSIALIEALLSGLPVVSTEVGGVPDLIVDGESGYLVAAPDDIDGFVAAIRRLRVTATRRALIEAAYATAHDRHSRAAFLAAVERELVR